MSLLLFHLVLSSFTFHGVDVQLAGRVLEWNLRRYPNGEFHGFVFGGGVAMSSFFYSLLKWFYGRDGVPFHWMGWFLFFFYSVGGQQTFHVISLKRPRTVAAWTCYWGRP